MIAAYTETAQAFPVLPALPPPAAIASLGTIAYLVENSRLGSATYDSTWQPGFVIANRQNALGLQTDVRQTHVRSRCTGKERDAETGLDYFGFRYFSSAQGRWTSPDQPFADQHVEDPQSWNMYAYVRNNPLAHVDPNGEACTVLNSGSGFCQRAELYANFDALVYNKTRFFAAASAATREIADVAVPILGTDLGGTSTQTQAFLESTGQALQQVNTATVGKIISGQITGSGPELDNQLVHLEQNTVQKQLDNLKQSDPTAYGNAVTQINGLLNGKSSPSAEVLGTVGRLFTTDGPYASVLAGVRKSLGHDINFANQKDREAIGKGLVKYIRDNLKGGCAVTGNEAHGCGH